MKDKELKEFEKRRKEFYEEDIDLSDDDFCEMLDSNGGDENET